MCAISGLAGLDSTINSISSTKNIAIANKESIICAWSLIKKSLQEKQILFQLILSIFLFGHYYKMNQLIMLKK